MHVQYIGHDMHTILHMPQWKTNQNNSNEYILYDEKKEDGT